MRPLTARERDLLFALIARGSAVGSDASIAQSDRERWAGQVAAAKVHGTCGCGSCPSIELAPSDEADSAGPSRRTVLEASTDDAFLLLFIDDDRPTYLELAPIGDDPITEFPLVADVAF
ncbi:MULTISPECIES: hypothetical protein [unclassified Plantibacter]|uniref:hypothetical protein n=1 Tax=unclassified Plantibacter TaxID=2624265 RepID=UPI0012F98034|nr:MULTISPECIES: hypothetical protein [unclassified Plantibacter]